MKGRLFHETEATFAQATSFSRLLLIFQIVSMFQL